jgi:hypothetical protein
VGLDRAAAKRAFDGFLEGRNLTAHQHEFVDMMIDHLTERGVMDPRLLYASPFTDIDLLGVAGVFKGSEVVQLIKNFEGSSGQCGGMTTAVPCRSMPTLPCPRRGNSRALHTGRERRRGERAIAVGVSGAHSLLLVLTQC